jgi:hypothetical protein
MYVIKYLLSIGSIPYDNKSTNITTPGSDLNVNLQETRAFSNMQR